MDISYVGSFINQYSNNNYEVPLYILVFQGMTNYTEHYMGSPVIRCKMDSPEWFTCKNGGYLDPKQNCEHCRCPTGLAGVQCTELEKSGPFFNFNVNVFTFLSWVS